MSDTLRSLTAVAAAVAVFTVPACAQQPEREGSAVEAGRIERMLGGGEHWKTDFSRITVPPEEILSGGPPKDGIPAIDDPRFVSAERADGWLEDREPAIVVEEGGEVKAYPLRILIWHEIVNDQVGGRPLAITYCPLCNTALVFRRRLDGRVLDFGTTGRLRHSDLVMYDRQTESWWQQATGEAIVGELAGRTLELHPASTLAWERVRALYPEVKVLSPDTGHRRSYGLNPYESYDSRRRPLPAFFRGQVDARLPAMERIVAIDLGPGWAAPFSALQKQRVVNAELERVPFVVIWTPGAASALDRARVPEGREVGQTAVFDRRLDGSTLSFGPEAEGGFRDRQSGSVWDLAGRAIAGPLRGKRLQPIAHGNHFWFAWAVFRPDTEIWSPIDDR